MIQLTLTLKMTTAQVVETSVAVNNNSPIQDYVHPVDQTQPNFEMTPGFKPFKNLTALPVEVLFSRQTVEWKLKSSQALPNSFPVLFGFCLVCLFFILTCDKPSPEASYLGFKGAMKKTNGVV